MYTPIELNYGGQKVLTNRQLTQIFGCTRQTIDGIFRNHIEEFAKGTDYFKLVEEDLRTFKFNFSRKTNLLAAGKYSCLPFSTFASCLYLWTQSGALKLSKFIGTDKAKAIYTQLAIDYFKSQEKALPAPSTQILNLEMYKEFKFLISNATDSTLRDQLIKMAVKLIG